MRRLSCWLGMLLGLLVLPALWGYAAASLQVIKAEAEVNFQRYTALVVKGFRYGVGDFLPPEAPRDLARKGRRL